MKQKWIIGVLAALVCVLLAAVLLMTIRCAMTDSLQGTWVQTHFWKHIQGERYRAEDMTYFVVYTFDGHGKGTKTTYSDGKTNTETLSYQLIHEGTDDYLQLGGEGGSVRLPLYFDPDMNGITLRILDENHKLHRLSFRRVAGE